MQFFSPLSRAAWGCALAAFLSACGGGSEPMSAADVTAAKLKQVTAGPVAAGAQCAAGAEGYSLVDGQCLATSNALGQVNRVIRTSSTTVTATITADVLFSWAQTTFPTLFPGAPATVTGAGFVYRLYSSGNAIGVTSTLAGVPSGTVLLLGPITGNALVSVGTLSSLNCTVAPGNCNGNPGTGTGGGISSYADCFSGTLVFTPGHTYQIDQSNSTNGNVVQTTSTLYTVNPQTTFRSNTATELVADTTVLTSTSGGAGTTSHSKIYSALTGSTYSTYGLILTVPITGIGTFDETIYYDPPLQTPTNLTVGQTYSVNTVLRYSSSNSLFSSFLPSALNLSYTFTFVGSESVTTPAGTFTACKTTAPATGANSTGVVTNWIVASGRYQGMFLKSDDGKGGVSVATKLLLDGS
jgi:hypothetical protein